MKNKFTTKLSLNLAMVLLIFSIAIGVTFMMLLKQHASDIHRIDLEKRADSIAETLSKFMEAGGHRGGYGAYLRFIDNIAGADAWVIDENMNVVTMGAHRRNAPEKSEFLKHPKAKEMALEALAGQSVFSDEFGIAAPIKNAHGEVLGAVLLRSPVEGLNKAFYYGFFILAASIALSLLISYGLSLRLEEANRESAKLEQLRRDFVANISHELRTPITVIKSSLEALSEKIITAPEKVDEYHVQMLNETKFLQRLVNDLLDLSRLQNPDFLITKEGISPRELMLDVIRSGEQLAKTKNIQIKADISDRDDKITGDYNRLRQMFMIALDNAVKFSPPGGIVEISVSHQNVSIKDYGAGIPPENLPYIFDRFYKVSDHNGGGTGLGLAIAKQIAERHNIKVIAESLQNAGAKFTFEFRGIKIL